MTSYTRVRGWRSLTYTCVRFTFSGMAHTLQAVENNPENRTAIGGRIAIARTAAGYERPAFATACGVAPNTLYRWERGEIWPEVASLESIGRVARVSIDWLLRGRRPEAPSEVLVRWRLTPQGRSASKREHAALSSLELEGYLPSESFYTHALAAMRAGLEPDQAARSAKLHETSERG